MFVLDASSLTLLDAYLVPFIITTSCYCPLFYLHLHNESNTNE